VRHDAYHIVPRYPSDGKSCDGENHTVASKGEMSREDDNNDDDNFSVAMALPAKRKAEQGKRNVVPRKVRKVIRSNDSKDDALLAKMDEFVKDVDPLAIN
jgi:hypothetical protein